MRIIPKISCTKTNADTNECNDFNKEHCISRLPDEKLVYMHFSKFSIFPRNFPHFSFSGNGSCPIFIPTIWNFQIPACQCLSAFRPKGPSRNAVKWNSNETTNASQANKKGAKFKNILKIYNFLLKMQEIRYKSNFSSKISYIFCFRLFLWKIQSI
jgi:hypothetical protein